MSFGSRRPPIPRVEIGSQGTNVHLIPVDAGVKSRLLTVRKGGSAPAGAEPLLLADDCGPPGALTAIFSYTFSKNFEQNHRLNNWNLDERPIHELVPYDKPQNLTFHGVWDSEYHYRRTARL